MEEETVFTCFVCDTPLASIHQTCPNCGYKYDDVEDMFTCPNKNTGICMLTENPCMKEEDFYTCPIKIEYDNECF